jgi:CheY-like chemotaxis protein
MVRLLDDLLDLSRISRGKVELRSERVELRTVVESALETCRPVVEAARHALTVTLPSAPVWLHADLTRLAQVVGNVLLNAAKYTPDGGEIGLVARVDGGEVVISVTDNGAGIPGELQDHVFEMFAQVHAANDRSQSGLGIGLALVKYLIEMHGGRVEVESPGPGRGSTFTLRLPLAGSVAAPQAVGRRDPEQVARGRLRVLVVDDNVDGAEMLAMMLELAGHETRVAGDGPGCLAAARVFRPDVAVLDIGLPGMDGHELARRLQDDPSIPDPVLIALTGWGSEDDKRRSKQAGFEYHLTKPVEADTITSLLARIVRGRAD